MRRPALALLALVLLRADMYQDASNAKQPDAPANLGVTSPDICIQANVRCDGAADDAPAINAVIQASPRVYQIRQGATIALGQTLVFDKPNTGLVTDGAGSIRHNAAPTTLEAPAIVKWVGAAGGTMISVKPAPAGTRALTGNRFGGFMLACDGGANKAGIGLEVINTYNAVFMDMTAYRCSQDHFLIGSGEYGESIRGVGNSAFRNLRVYDDLGSGNGVRTFATTTGNVHHNVFQSIAGSVNNGNFFEMDGADSNVMINVVGGATGTGGGIVLGYGQTRANAGHVFYHACGGNGPSTGAFVIGGNGGADGVTTSGSPAYTSDRAAFNQYDVGRGITGANIPGGATILSVQTPRVATMSASATGTGTGLAYTVTGRAASSSVGVMPWLITNGCVPPVWGTGATVGLQRPETLREWLNNVVIGFNSALNATGDSNTIVGRNAGLGLTTGGENTLIGAGAGTGITTGGKNTFVGRLVGQTLSTGTNNTVIGNDADCDVAAPTTAGNLLLCAGSTPVVLTTGGLAPATSVTTFAGTVVGKPPTSCAGLAAGTLWNSAGAPGICP